MKGDDSLDPAAWLPTGEMEKADGSKFTSWANRKTGEKAFLPPGTHPIDNPNAIVKGDMVPVTLDSDPTGESEEAVDKLSAMMGIAQGKDDAKVKVYKQGAEKEWTWCKDYQPAQLAEAGYELIRATFGGGKYKIVLYARNQTTKKVSIYKSEEITLMELPESVEMMTETTGNSGGGLMTQLLSRMMDKLDAMDQRISTPAPTVDPMAALTANLTMIAQIKEIFAPPPAVDPMDSIAKLVTVISGARELSEVISPAPMPDNPLLAMAGPLMGIIGKAMEQKQLAAPPVNAQDPGATPVFVPETNTALPPAVATGPATNPGPSPASGGATEMTPLESALFTLRQMRGLGVDPEIVASAAYEKLGDVEMAFVQRPDWFEQLQQAMPGEEIHKDWYEKVRGFILQWDAEEQSATVTAAAAGPKGKR